MAVSVRNYENGQNGNKNRIDPAREQSNDEEAIQYGERRNDRALRVVSRIDMHQDSEESQTEQDAEQPGGLRTHLGNTTA